MGTTITPNLGLIKPDGNEPGSNFPAQHAANQDILDLLDPRIDTLEALIAAAWSSWTPSYTGFSLGNGNVETAKYKVIGKVCHWKLRIVLGSTSSVTGLIVASLPVAPLGPDDCPLGGGYINDASNNANRQLVMPVRNSNGTHFHMLAPGGTVTNGTFGGWGSGDSFNCSGSYEVA